MSLQFDFNCLYDNMQDEVGSSQGSNSIFQNPLPVDLQESNNDYHLLDASPAINSGESGEEMGAYGSTNYEYAQYDLIPPNVTILTPIPGAVVNDIVGNGEDPENGLMHLQWRVTDAGGSGYDYSEFKIENSITGVHNNWVGPISDALVEITIPLTSLADGSNTLTVRAWDHNHIDPDEKSVSFKKLSLTGENAVDLSEASLVCPLTLSGTATNQTGALSRVDLCFNYNNYNNIDEDGNFTEDDQWGWINILMSDCQILNNNGQIPQSQQYVNYTQERVGWFKVFSYPSVEDPLIIGFQRYMEWVFRAPKYQLGKKYTIKIDCESTLENNTTKIEVWNTRKQIWEILGEFEESTRTVLEVPFVLIKDYWFESQGIKLRATFIPSDGGDYLLYSFKIESSDINYTDWSASYYLDSENPGYIVKVDNNQTYRQYSNSIILSRAVASDNSEEKHSIQNKNMVGLDINIDMSPPQVASVSFTPSSLEYSRTDIVAQIQFNEVMRGNITPRVDLLPFGKDETIEGNYVPFFNGVFSTTKYENDTYTIGNIEDITSLTGNGEAKLRIKYAQDRARNPITVVMPSSIPSYGFDINIPKRKWMAKLTNGTNENRRIVSTDLEEILDTASDPLSQGLFVATENGFTLYYDVDDYPSYSLSEKRGANDHLTSISPDELGGLWAIKFTGFGSYDTIVYYKRQNVTTKNNEGIYYTFKTGEAYAPIQYKQDLERTFQSATNIMYDMGNPVKIVYDQRLSGLWVIVRSVKDNRYAYIRFISIGTGRAFDILDPEINEPYKLVYNKNLVLDYEGYGVWLSNNDKLVHCSAKTQTIDKVIQTDQVRKLQKGQTLWYIERNSEGQNWVNYVPRSEVI